MTLARQLAATLVCVSTLVACELREEDQPGYKAGYDAGYEEGKEEGIEEGKEQGKEEGKEEVCDDVMGQSSEVYDTLVMSGTCD